jgi:hypothetical protein
MYTATGTPSSHALGTEVQKLQLVMQCLLKWHLLITRTGVAIYPANYLKLQMLAGIVHADSAAVQR